MPIFSLGLDQWAQIAQHLVAIGLYLTGRQIPLGQRQRRFTPWRRSLLRLAMSCGTFAHLTSLVHGQWAHQDAELAVGKLGK